MIFIHAKFKNYFSRTQLLFSLTNHLNGFFDFEKKAKASKDILDKNEDRKQTALSNNKLTEFGNCPQVAFKGDGIRGVPEI